MLPWNFLLSVTSFWNYKFRNVSIPGDDPIPVPSDLDFVNHTSTLFSSYANDIPISPTLTPTLLATMVSITACRNFSCHMSESGIDNTVRLTNETNNIVMAQAILVDTLKYKQIK